MFVVCLMADAAIGDVCLPIARSITRVAGRRATPDQDERCEDIAAL